MFILALIISFFLGRESKEIDIFYQTKGYKIEEPIINDSSYLSKQNHFLFPKLKDSIKESLKKTDTVYRCGQSKIYHPTPSHSSFMRCKSQIYKLTNERAIALGMRHCKCSG